MEMYGSMENCESVTEEKLGKINIENIRSYYSESKRLCELLCRSYSKEYNVKVKIARLAQTIMVGVLKNDNRVFAQFANSVMNNKDIILHTDGKSEENYVYSIDAVAGILLLNRGNSGEAYNVSNESNHMIIAEMAQMVCDNFSGGNGRLVFDIPIDINKYGYVPNVKLFLNYEKLRSIWWHPKFNL